MLPYTFYISYQYDVLPAVVNNQYYRVLSSINTAILLPYPQNPSPIDTTVPLPYPQYILPNPPTVPLRVDLLEQQHWVGLAEHKARAARLAQLDQLQNDLNNLENKIKSNSNIFKKN